MNQNAILKIVSRPWFLFLVYLLTEWVLYSFLGVQFQLESRKYINEANHVLSDHALSQARYLFYFSTIFVIAVAVWMKIGLYGALFLLIAFNLLSYYVFFRALKKKFSALHASLIILACMLFWPYQSWTLSLYSENFFYSSVILLLAQLLNFERLSVKSILSLIVIVLLVVISRPLGILCVPGVLAFIFFRLNKNQKIIFSLSIVLFVFLLNYISRIVFTTTPDWAMARPLKESFLICDIPGPAPEKPLRLSQDPNPLYQLWFYITENFSTFIRLAAVRMKLFFLLTRDYYSTFHNIFLLATVIPLYIIIIAGIRRIRKNARSLAAFLWITVLAFALSVAVQCDDYHNRFFLALWPLFILLAAFALFRKRSGSTS